MKKFLVFLCSMLLVFGMAGVAGAGLFIEQYAGYQHVYEGQSYNFFFDFWLADAGATNSSLTKVQDAQGAESYDWLNMSASVTLHSIDWAPEIPEIEITAWTSSGDEQIVLWSHLLFIHEGWFTDDEYTWTYDFTDDEVAAFEDQGWGDVNISAIPVWLLNNDFAITDVTMQVEAVPEPATMLLLGSGLVGLAAVGRRKFFKR